MSSMAELLAKMKAEKAKAGISDGVVAARATSQPNQAAPTPNVLAMSNVMDKLDQVRDKPIDYIGETIDSSPRKLNPSTEGELIKSRIAKLEAALEKEIPDYAHILHEIHKRLSKDDELTHLLNDDEVGVLIRAMKLRKNVVLVEEKNKKSAKKSLKNTTLDDIL